MIKLNGQIIKQDHFPDGTLLIKCDIDNGNCYIKWYYESDAELFTLYCIVQHIRRICYNTSIHLIMPYIPHARMDRVKTCEDVFTLKYFTEILNAMNFDNIEVVDPHSSVSEALINNIYITSPINYINQAIKKCNPNILFFPDEGAMKRYSSMINKEYAFGIKRRDWATGKIEGLDVTGCTDKIKDSRILIVDDICSRGGTFYHSAKKLKELGAKEIYLYVTHCENTILEGELLTSGLIERVYTTNSIFTKEHEKIEVFKL